MAPTKSVIFAQFAKFCENCKLCKKLENLLKQQASSSFSLQVWLLALQSRLHLLLVTYKQTNYTTLTSTCNTNDFVNAESHTSKRETSACRVKRRLRGS